MTTDTFLSFACATLIASLFGLAMTFAGYKLFRLLLPFWGFFFGLWFGAQTIQVLFNVGFLTTVTSWVVGLIVGILFAVLAYPFYLFAVAVVAASLGYLFAWGVLLWLGMPVGFLLWLIGVVVAAAFTAVTLIFNLQKWVIMIATTVLGAGLIVFVFTVLFKPHAVLLENPVKVMLQTSPLLLITFLLLLIFGIIVQYKTNRGLTVAEPTAPIKPLAAEEAGSMAGGAGGAAPAGVATEEAGAAGGAAPGVVAVGAAGAAAAAVVSAAEPSPKPVPVVAAVPEVKAPEMLEGQPLVEAIPAGADEAEKFKYNLEYVEGIGPVYAGKLRAIGIANPGDLLEKGAFPKGREEIARSAGISPALVLEWVNHVDLFRIMGVGSEYADLLEEAGVDTVVELAMRNPDNLLTKMVSVNEAKKLVRKLPVLEQVKDWVEQAKSLPRKINY